jgi:cytochrome c-type biogenesis protein CcmH
MLSGIALYAAIGRPDAVDSESHLRSAAKSPVDTAGKQELASVNQMLAGLEERLRQQPDDGKGWLLLAKSYDHLGRKADSVNAYTRARELGVEDNAPPASVAGEAPATRYPHDSRGIESVDSLVD